MKEETEEIGKKIRTDVGCPFFIGCTGAKRICCEGVADGSKLEWVFKTKADYLIHLKTFCCQHYKKCEVYRLAMEKYED